MIDWSVVDRAAASLGIYRNIDHSTGRHLMALPRQRLASRPGTDLNRHRATADADDTGEQLDQISDANRREEAKLLHRHGRDTALRQRDGNRGSGNIGLRQHPAAEDITVRIGVRRHRQHPQSELPARRVLVTAWIGVPAGLWMLFRVAFHSRMVAQQRGRCSKHDKQMTRRGGVWDMANARACPSS